MTRIRSYLLLVRLHHWIKNLFLFIPIFFAGMLFDLERLQSTSIGFLAFGLIASFIYIMNDYRDIENDRIHPEKSKRPLASGAISYPAALVLAFLMLPIGLALGWHIGLDFLTVLVIYLFINILYSFGLKKVAILDILILASGFLLRVIAGGLAADVPISEWLLIIFFLLALFLSIAKRRDDVLLYEADGSVVRESTKSYNREFLNSLLTFISGIVMVAYIMYCIFSDISSEVGSKYLLSTAVFVLAGLMRYMQITLVENNSSSPTKILYTDLFLIVTIVLWVILFTIILYQ